MLGRGPAPTRLPPLLRAQAISAVLGIVGARRRLLEADAAREQVFHKLAHTPGNHPVVLVRMSKVGYGIITRYELVQRLST